MIVVPNIREDGVMAVVITTFTFTMDKFCV
jgi:hypothetical protein